MKAMFEEKTSLHQNQTQDFAELLAYNRARRCNGIFKKKQLACRVDEPLYTIKNSKRALVNNHITIKFLLAMNSHEGMDIEQLNRKTMFLLRYLKDTIFILLI